LTNLGSELEKCVGSRVHLVGGSISFEKNFYRLPLTPPPLVRLIGPSQSSSRQTNPSHISPQPVCGIVFGRVQPGSNTGQVRKHVHLQPMGARPTWATLTNAPLQFRADFFVLEETDGRGGGEKK
jgi:hypothetical protein